MTKPETLGTIHPHNNTTEKNDESFRFDDVEIEYDVELKAYRVPAFADRRANYSEAKQVDCDRWGSE